MVFSLMRALNWASSPYPGTGIIRTYIQPIHKTEESDLPLLNLSEINQLPEEKEKLRETGITIQLVPIL